MAATGRTGTKPPVGSTTHVAIGQEFNAEAVTALEMVRAMLDRFVQNGILTGQDASAIHDATSRQVLVRSTEAEAKATTPEPVPRNSERPL